jgi:hypothetical protein
MLFGLVLIELNGVTHESVHLFQRQSGSSPHESQVLLSFSIGERLQDLPEKFDRWATFITISVVSDGFKVLEIKGGVSNNLLL